MPLARVPGRHSDAPVDHVHGPRGRSCACHPDLTGLWEPLKCRWVQVHLGESKMVGLIGGREELA